MKMSLAAGVACVGLLGCSAADQRLAGADSSRPVQDLVQQKRLMATLAELPVSRAALGDEASREGLRKTEKLIQQELIKLGYTPTMQEFRWALPAQHWPVMGSEEKMPSPETLADKPGASKSPTADKPAAEMTDDAKLQEHTWHNIIVNIPGSELPQEVVLVGAHFDAVPGAPGADDNGSGAAALMEMARVLRGHAMKRTVRLVFFNLEECGLVGSTQYVKLMKQAEKGADAKEKIIGMMSLEMLGYFSDEPNSQKSPIPPIKDVFEPPTVGDSIAVVGIKRDQPFISKLAQGMQSSSPLLKLTVVDFLPIPVPDMTRSDHRPFLLAGIPAVMITDTANFRNPNYHKPTDTIATIDAARYTLVVKGLAGAVYGLAEPAGVK